MTGRGERSASPLAGETPRWLRIALFAAWALAAGWLAAHHVLWRDEVRALNLALSGADLAAMWRTVHGDGHPALWFLMLRGAHAWVADVRILPAVAMLVGAAAAGLLAAGAPFRPLILAACLLSGWLVQDYAVMARDYGIAALIILLFARRAAAGRWGGVVTGLMLVLLCNANVPAIPIAAGFLLFRLADLIERGGERRDWRDLAVATGLAIVGVVLAFATVYPPFNDAASRPVGAMGPARLVALVGGIGMSMRALVPFAPGAGPAGAIAVTLLLVSAPLSLARSAPACLAASAVMVVLGLFFQLVYPASGQQAALYLVFVLALHWIVAARPGDGRRLDAVAIGGAGFVLLLLVQSATLAAIVGRTARGEVAGRARDVGRLLVERHLERATVIADQDALIEALPYYAANPTYLVRERRWSRIPHFTRHAIVALTLAELLATARTLARATGRPVVILVSLPLDRAPARSVDGYGRSIAATAEETWAFRAATAPLARFGAAATDERYDAYLLMPPTRNRSLSPPGR